MTTLTAAQAVEVCSRHGINPNALIFSDGELALPALDWVTHSFGPAWAEAKRLLQIERYESESNDCDDYARMCAGYAQMLHNLTVKQLRSDGQNVRNTSLAFGEFWYVPPSGAHAINAFLYRTAAAAPVQIGFVEPQTSQLIYPSSHEIKSCSLLRL